MFKKLLIVPVLILAGCGVEFPAERTYLEVSGYEVMVEEFAKGEGSDGPYYNVSVLKVPFKQQKSIGIEAIEKVANCKVDVKTVRLIDAFSGGGIYFNKPQYMIASTVCQMANNTQE